MILRRVDRLQGGMKIKDFNGLVWTIESVSPFRHGRMCIMLFNDPGEPPVEGHNLFPDDMVEIVQ